MMEWLPINHWHWLILGVLLVTLEILTASFFIIWVGLAALLLGIATFFVPVESWELQVLIFSGLSAASLLVGHRFARRWHAETEAPNLNQGAEQYIGRHLTLTDAIVHGIGRVNLEGTSWRVAGPDTPKDEIVVVTGVSGATLNVLPIERH